MLIIYGVFISKLAVRSSLISGHGTFAKQTIARGEYITTLTGEPFTYEQAEKECQIRGISFDDALQIDDDVMLILDEPARVINHSCQPNAGIRNRNDLYAIRDIKVGEEITYDYSTTANPNEKWTMRCCCENRNCREIIGSVLTIPHENLTTYLALDALPDFIKRYYDQISHLLRKEGA